ncbi:hypothetical protein CR513_53841, partial [Mucuna pruriens]
MTKNGVQSTMEEILLKVLRDNKKVFGWIIHDVENINSFPRALPQHHLNPNMKEVVKGEIIKLLDANISYLISNIEWVSLVSCVTKKKEPLSGKMSTRSS